MGGLQLPFLQATHHSVYDGAMAVFRKKQQAAFGVAPVQAAAGAARQNQIGQYYAYSAGADMERAQTLPTLSRAQNLIVSMVAGLDLQEYRRTWTGEEYELVKVPNQASWISQPDPSVTRQFFLGSITSDLLWYGRAFAFVTARQGGWPASFTWLPAGSVQTPDQVGPVWFGMSQQIQFQGATLNPADVVQFVNPTPGWLYTGSRVIDIAIRLDSAARRFASNEIAAGYLQVQPGGEPMGPEDLAAMAQSWSTARQTNAIGALNELVRWVSFDQDPSKLQLTEGRQYAALELSRVANIPPFLVGVDVPGMTYQNAQETMKQLWLLGAKPVMATIEETLSLPHVMPANRLVKFDVDSIVGDIDMAEDEPAQSRDTSPDLMEEGTND